MNIVSLLPSATEIICSLGLRDSLLGVSHSCDFPADVHDLPVLTSTTVPRVATSEEIDRHVRAELATRDALYALDVEALAKLEPDVIVAQTLCDVCAVSSGDVLSAIARLPTHPALIELEPTCLNDVFTDVRRVGAMTRTPRQADAVVAELEARLHRVRQRNDLIPVSERPRVVFLEWLDPPFNGGHWNPEIVELAGGIDCLGAPGLPARTLEWTEVVDSLPEVVFVACCGFDAKRTEVDLERLARTPYWSELPAVRSGHVYFVDGDAFFSRPGPRLLDALEAMAHCLHPHHHPSSKNCPVYRCNTHRPTVAARRPCCD